MRFPRPRDRRCKFDWNVFRFKRHEFYKYGEQKHVYTPGMANMGYLGVDLQQWKCKHCGIIDATINGYEL